MTGGADPSIRVMSQELNTVRWGLCGHDEKPRPEIPHYCHKLRYANTVVSSKNRNISNRDIAPAPPVASRSEI